MFGFEKKCSVSGFVSKTNRDENEPNVDMFHSCTDIPNSQHHNYRMMSNQVIYNGDCKSPRHETVTNNCDKVISNSVRSNRSQVSIKHHRMNPNARSQSLSDLSTGLTLSLIGQKKSDSVMSITGKAMACSSSAKKYVKRGTLALKDAQGRATRAATSGQNGALVESSLYSCSNLQTDQAKSSYKHPQTTQSTPHQQKLQHQQCQYIQHHKPQQQTPQEYSGNPNTVQQRSCPTARKDPEDTDSSYRSTLSEWRPSPDVDIKCDSKTSVPLQASDSSITNRTFNPCNSLSIHSTLKDTTSHKIRSVVSIPGQLDQSNRGHSVPKPRRSLPNVPVNEASERIKRFTEIMKSRMSVNSNRNKSCSVDSCSSKYSSSRRSSVGSASSQTDQSRKSSLEASDNDAFVISSKQHCQSVPEYSQHTAFLAVNEVATMKPVDSCQQTALLPPKSSGCYSESNDPSRNVRTVNRRKTIDGDVFLQNFDQRMHHDNNLHKNSDDFCHRGHNNNVWYGQNQYVFRDQAIETNSSHHGSTIDSGYTTNNDGENDSCKSNLLHRSYHKTQKEYVQHADQYKENNPRHARNDQAEQLCKSNHPQHSTNMINAHRFGSVQNVSNTQFHRNSKECNLPTNSNVLTNDEHQYFTSQSLLFCYKKVSNKNMSESMISHDSTSSEHVLPVNQLQLKNMHLTAQRKSWDCLDNIDGNSKNHVLPSNHFQRFEHADERYRSSDTLLLSRLSVNGNYTNMSQTGHLSVTQTQQFKMCKQPTSGLSKNSISDSEKVQLNAPTEFTPLKSQPLHPELNHGQDRMSDHFVDHSYGHKSKAVTVTDSVQFSNHKRLVGDCQSSSSYKLSNGTSQQQGEVKPQPIPASRGIRLIPPHVHPRGFSSSESDCASHQYSTMNQDMSLFHLTQKYDLAPLLINLAHNMVLRDMVDLCELSVEMFMVGISCLPSNFLGKAPQIGTPGSAFTPVKTSVDRDKSLTAEGKVICFSSVCDEIHQYTTLGRILKGDIVIEVNGWFCLGADVIYSRKIIENCKGEITLTVARLKENDDVRFKGLTAAERIKGLESEISRLDDLIQARDDKIKSLTVVNFKQHTGTLVDINGKVPLEGMRIGNDEYVV